MDIKDKWWISETGNVVNKDGIIWLLPDTSDKSKATAKLIAEAPELLEVLQEITDFVERMVQAKMINPVAGKTIRNRANAAIQKATQ